MQITVFNGSPRAERGNTHALVKEFLAGAEAAGAQTTNIFLTQHAIEPCRGCFACWRTTPGACVIDDGMKPLLALLSTADVAVFATPLYVDNVSGPMKNFMDRMIPLLEPRIEKDGEGEARHPPRAGAGIARKLVVISNCGFPEQSHFQVLRLLFRRIARNASADLVGEIYRGGGEIFSSRNPLLPGLLEPYRALLRRAGGEVVETGRISEALMAELERPLVAHDLYIQNVNRYWDRHGASG